MQITSIVIFFKKYLIVFIFKFMFSIFNKKAKKQKVAGEDRYFDRTYYFKINNRPKFGNRDYENFAYDGYMSNVIVYRAINMISRAVSSIGLCYFELTSNGEKKELNDNDKIIQLLKHPNPTESYVQFIEKAISSYLLSGNIYIQAVRGSNDEIEEMYLLRSDRISIAPGIGNIPSYYRYKIGNLSFDFVCDEHTGMSDILHIKTFNPLDDWYGLSPMEPAQYSIEQHNECIKWNKSLLENGARPCGALVVKQNLSDNVYNRLKSDMDDNFKSSENSGKYMILEGGVEWKEMGCTPKDMDYIETKNSSARDIAMAFGIQPQLLGIKGDTTYNNMSEARMTFWEDTVLPITNLFLSSISKWFSQSFNREIIIEPDLDTIQSLAEQRQKTWETVNNSDFVSKEEKRESLGFEANDKLKQKNTEQ